MAQVKPMLGEIELQLVQQLEVNGIQVLAEHCVPALEGDFLQGLGRRGTCIVLSGMLTGTDAGKGLKDLREKFRAAEPVSFVADINTATKMDKVIIEKMEVKELAGKPERFEYAFMLREYTPLPPAATEEPPKPDVPKPPDNNIDKNTGILRVEVIVEGQTDFDYSHVVVTVEGKETDGTALSRTLTNRTDNIWTEEKFPAGDFTIKASANSQPMSGSAKTSVQAGQTAQVTISLKAVSSNIARAFTVHFWFDKAFIEPCMKQVLQAAAKYASDHSDEKLVIVGHTDLVGDSDYNQSLSERRARAVYAYVTAGLDREAAVKEWNELRKKATGEKHDIKDSWSTREYQYILQDLDYYTGNIDEQHGPKTSAAVRSFQKFHNLPVNGIVDDATWQALIGDYLDQDALNIPENQFLRNSKEGCDGGILKWLGCGEQDPVKNTQDAWRPNRRTELLFVQADKIPCEVPKPVTFDRPSTGAVGSTWCLGPDEGNNRCCFTSRDSEQPNKWLIQPAEPGNITVSGSITFDDGTPVANAKYALIAPDGEFLHTDSSGKPDLGEWPQGSQRGRPIPNQADENGKFSYPRETPVGIYTMVLLDLKDPQVAKKGEDTKEDAVGNVICTRLSLRTTAALRDAKAFPSLLPIDVLLSPVLPGTVNPVITLASSIVVAKKSYTNPARVQVTLSTNSAFKRSGTLTSSGSAIQLFTAATGGSRVIFNGKDNVFTGRNLSRGVKLFAESTAPSTALNDYKLTLTLTPGPTPVGPDATVTMTAVGLTLDICMSRTAIGVDPSPLPQPATIPCPAGTAANDKWCGGRFVHIQDPGNHHGRALLIVRQVQPTAFAADLVLRQVIVAGNDITGLDTKVQIFDNEVPTAGEVAKVNPHNFNSSTIPAAGLKFWVEGRSVSVSLRDTGFQLGIKNFENDGDRVKMTVVQFSRLSADIPSTPAHKPRLGNSPVARHTLTRGVGVALSAADFDEDFAVNSPLVLIEGAVLATDPINMSIVIAPAGAPVSWSVQRDTRPAPNGDHPSIISLSPNALPTITPNSANPLQATLICNAVGSFHLRPFIDCNGKGIFDQSIDRQPFMIMNLVLIRAVLHLNNTVPQSVNFKIGQQISSGGSPIVGSILVLRGPFNINAPTADFIHLNSQVDLIGGGDDGLRGVDQVFAGWTNNESAREDIAGIFRDTTVTPPVNHSSFSVFASNRALATGGSSTDPIFLPPDPAPVLVDPPLLDTGRSPAGTGGDNACLRTSRIRLPRINLRTPAAPTAVGQRLIVEAVDSPSDGEFPTHPGFPAAKLIRFRFGLDFSAFLCVWTDLAGVSGAVNNPAIRLYSVLLQVDWRMRGEWTVDPVTGAFGVVITPSVSIVTQNITSPAVAAVSTPVEVRSPTGLSLLARDARA